MKSNLLIFLFMLFNPTFILAYAKNTCPSDYLKYDKMNTMHFLSLRSVPLNFKFFSIKSKKIILYLLGEDFVKKIDKYPYEGEYYFTEKQKVYFEICENDNQLKLFSFFLEDKTTIECIISNKIKCTKK